MGAPSRTSRLAAKAAPCLLLAVMLAGGLFYGVRRTIRWVGEMKSGPRPLFVFLAECQRTIPLEARVIIVPPDDGLIPASDLYPRPVRFAKTVEEAVALAGKEDWIVFFTDPFEAGRTIVKRARDLR